MGRQLPGRQLVAFLLGDGLKRQGRLCPPQAGELALNPLPCDGLLSWFVDALRVSAGVEAGRQGLDPGFDLTEFRCMLARTIFCDAPRERLAGGEEPHLLVPTA